ncbi:MAG TPA: glycosyltransferase family 4 protein [Vicinamibacterales bacterium]|nr:glycosyltransferase family 4 protein [Vicinamibacterales bacterium]
MRIGISTWTRRLAGGVETYLAALVPALLDRGHDVSLLHEVDDPADRAPITLAGAVPHWCASDGVDGALAGLTAWRPDVIFAQGLEDPGLEARVAAIAPAVLFAHAYRGTCVSGTKTFAALENTPCARRLGWQCLVHYLPHRCGGLNPLTMTRMYRRESHRRDLLDQYASVVMFSEHIQQEYVRHGVASRRTHRLPCHVPSTPQQVTGRKAGSGGVPSRVVFIGRMETLKGGQVLLEALPAVQASLGRPLHVTFAGDGRRRLEWEAQAKKLFATGAGSRVEFTGWLRPDERTRLLAEADLLVVPSLWPEPFGLIGLEAAACGVPSAAFDVGGISEWLHDGVNGHLASAGSPRADNLAAAIVKCLRDPAGHAALARGAVEVASRHSMPAHVSALLAVLNAAASPVARVNTDDPAA